MIRRMPTTTAPRYNLGYRANGSRTDSARGNGRLHRHRRRQRRRLEVGWDASNWPGASHRLRRSRYTRRGKSVMPRTCSVPARIEARRSNRRRRLLRRTCSSATGSALAGTFKAARTSFLVGVAATKEDHDADPTLDRKIKGANASFERLITPFLGFSLARTLRTRGVRLHVIRKQESRWHGRFGLAHWPSHGVVAAIRTIRSRQHGRNGDIHREPNGPEPHLSPGRAGAMSAWHRRHSCWRAHSGFC